MLLLPLSKRESSPFSSRLHIQYKAWRQCWQSSIPGDFAVGGSQYRHSILYLFNTNFGSAKRINLRAKMGQLSKPKVHISREIFIERNKVKVK